MSELIPYEYIEKEETLHAFYSFCTYVAICGDKKMNYATVFLKILDNKGMCDIFVSVMEEENIFNAVKKFIQIEPSVTKSKYISKFLNRIPAYDGTQKREIFK